MKAERMSLERFKRDTKRAGLRIRTIGKIAAVAFIIAFSTNIRAQQQESSTAPVKYKTYADYKKADQRDKAVVDSLGRAINKQQKDFHQKIHNIHKAIDARSAIKAARSLVEKFKNKGTFTDSTQEKSVRHQIYREIRLGQVDPRDSRGYTMWHEGVRYTFSQAEVADSFGISKDEMKSMGYVMGY